MTDSAVPRSARVPFWIGWGALVFIVAGLTLNHAAGLFRYSGSPVERLTFPVYIALGLYALAVLFWPYRRGSWWAWAATWIFVAVTAVSFAYLEPVIGWYYVGAAVVMAAAQLLALPRFRRGS